MRSILLLAPYPFERNVLLDGAATTDRSLDGIAAACASDPSCASAFPDLEASIERLRDPDPPADVDWPLFTAMVRMMLFFPLPTTQIPSILDSVAADCRPPRPGRTDNQLAGWISEGAFLSILCAEDASRTSLEAVNERSAGSFLGSGWAESLLASCAVWPRRPLPDDFEAPIRLETPTLLLVGGLDPAMPPSWSRELVNGMPRARVVEVPEGQHSFIGMSGVGCLLSLMRDFLEAGSAESLDATCVDTMRRPAFLIPGS